MRLIEAATPTFARHETFHPRYGWFRKAYAAAADDPLIFGRPDAPLLLGVGKNMVRAIRFWGLAAKLIVEDPATSSRRASSLIPTQLGHALFGETGWDPYMEDPGTLWLLHWRLLAPPCQLPVWWLAFNSFDAVEFADTQLEGAVTTQLTESAWGAPHRSSIRKDISALLRTYAPADRARRQSFDDVLDCPMRELHLIGRSEATDGLRFSLGSKASLPAAVVAHAVLDWVARAGGGANTVTLGRVASEPGSVGRVFKLSEAELLAALEMAVADCDGLGLAAPTGALQLSWSQPPDVLAVRVLDDYYRTEAGPAADHGSAGDSFAVRAGHLGDRPIADELLRELGLGRDPADPLRRLREACPLSPAAAGETSPSAG